MFTRTPDPAALPGLRPLRSPHHIQAYLDRIPYSTEPIYRCPARVLRDEKAHCFDGAVLAAAALQQCGHPPLLVNLRAVRDDDHVLAVFRVRGRWGAVSKSNIALLRFREPVYRSLRELVMSYWEFYFSTERIKSLRAHSLPVDLRAVKQDWLHQDHVMGDLARALDARRHVPLLTDAMVAQLGRTDRRTYAAGMVGTNPRGLYRPRPRS